MCEKCHELINGGLLKQVVHTSVVTVVQSQLVASKCILLWGLIVTDPSFLFLILNNHC